MVNKLKSAGFRDVLRMLMGDLNRTIFQEWRRIYAEIGLTVMKSEGGFFV